VVDAATGTPRRALLKPAEVCDLLKVQPYVLRTWETEFPDLGVSRSAGGPRFYRPSDIEQAQRIKQLVFSEGLTLAGARRKIEEERAAASGGLPFDEEVFEPAPGLPADARARITGVRSGLRSLLELLSHPPRRGDARSDVAQGFSPAGSDVAQGFSPPGSERTKTEALTNGHGTETTPVPAKKKRRRAGASE